jgi:hypothetical protein
VIQRIPIEAGDPMKLFTFAGTAAPHLEAEKFMRELRVPRPRFCDLGGQQASFNPDYSRKVDDLSGAVSRAFFQAVPATTIVI